MEHKGNVPYINERVTSILVLPKKLMIEGEKDKFGDLTKQGRFFDYFLDSRICCILRRAIDVH